MRSRKRPEKLTFFIDRSLGRKFVAGALRAQGAHVELHDDHFPQDARDEDWLLSVGKRRWVVLTQDSKIRYRSIQKRAVEQAGVRMFVLVSKNLQGPQMAEAFSFSLSRMDKLARKQTGPFIAKVFRNGKVQMWEDFQFKERASDT